MTVHRRAERAEIFFFLEDIVEKKILKIYAHISTAYASRNGERSEPANFDRLLRKKL